MAGNGNIRYLGNFESIQEVWAALPGGGQQGDYITINGNTFSWNKYIRQWQNSSTVVVTPTRETQTHDGDMNIFNDTRVGGNLVVIGKIINDSIEDGKSAYEVWLDQEGNTGKSIDDFWRFLTADKGFRKEIVSELPNVGEAEPDTLYLVGNGSSYTVSAVVDGVWATVLTGDTSLDTALVGIGKAQNTLATITDNVGIDYHKEFATAPTSFTSIGVGVKEGDVIRVSVSIGDEEYANNKASVVIIGRNTGSNDVAITTKYSRSGTYEVTINDDYEEIGFRCSDTYTDYTIKIQTLYPNPSVLDIAAKNDVCVASGFEAKRINDVLYAITNVQSEYFRLREGTVFRIVFNNVYATSSTGIPSLNVNGTGVKPVYLNGKLVSVENTWKPNVVMVCYYDGTSYHLSELLDKNNGKVVGIRGLLDKVYTNNLLFEDITQDVEFESEGKIYSESTDITETSAYKYSNSIQLLKGQAIVVQGYGNKFVPISEGDAENNIIGRLVIENTNSYTSSAGVWTYVADKDMYVIINVQFSSGGTSLPSPVIRRSTGLYNFNFARLDISTQKTGELYENNLAWKDITNTLELNEGRYGSWGQAGVIEENQSYRYSEPIFLESGRAIRIKSAGNSFVPISESDENGTILARLVVYSSSDNQYAYYNFTTERDMYIVVCGKVNDTSTPMKVEIDNGLYSLDKVKGYFATVFDGISKYHKNNDGRINSQGQNTCIFTSDDVSSGETLYYRIVCTRTTNPQWCIRFYDAEKNTLKSVSMNPCEPNKEYMGSFVVPENFDHAGTAWLSHPLTVARKGTSAGDAIISEMMQSDVESLVSAASNGTNLPSYYKDYLDEKEVKIRNLQLGITGEEDSFIFITDTHWIDNYKQSPAIIESLLKRGLTNKVVFGGDLMGLHSDVDGETQSETLEHIKTQIDFHRKFASTVLACGGIFFNVRGNHDINGYPATKTTQQGDDTIEMWRANQNATKNILLQPTEVFNRIKNVSGLNYVFDNDAKNNRYIIFDGLETHAWKNYNGNVPYSGEPILLSNINMRKAKFDIEIPSGYTEGSTAVKLYIGTDNNGVTEWQYQNSLDINSINGEQVRDLGIGSVGKKLGFLFGGNYTSARLTLTLTSLDGSNGKLETTLNWLKDALISTPANYDILVFSHYAAIAATGSSYVPDIGRIVNAYNNKANVTINSTPCNFTNVQGKILAYISGHTHKNLQSFSAGVTHICIACDARYSENPYMNEKPYSRAQGTVSEQLLDFIQIDKEANMIYCKRVGAGYDRYFHTEPKSIGNGNSTTLESTMLSGELTWGCYDNDEAVTKTNETEITSSRVTVSNGVVTGTAVGEAVVYAMDATGKREFFEVIVG